MKYTIFILCLISQFTLAQVGDELRGRTTGDFHESLRDLYLGRSPEPEDRGCRPHFRVIQITCNGNEQAEHIVVRNMRDQNLDIFFHRNHVILRKIFLLDERRLSCNNCFSDADVNLSSAQIGEYTDDFFYPDNWVGESTGMYEPKSVRDFINIQRWGNQACHDGRPPVEESQMFNSCDPNPNSNIIRINP